MAGIAYVVPAIRLRQGFATEVRFGGLLIADFVCSPCGLRVLLCAIPRSSASARFLYIALLDKRSQKFHGLVFAEVEVRDNLPARRRAFFFDESIYQFLIAGQSGPRVGRGKRDSHGVFAYVEFGFLLVFGI